MYLERWGTVNLVKNHLLDSKITTAAFVEFLEKGFSQASLHQISEKAGVTTGALYTRYKNKNDLFCALVKDVYSSYINDSQKILTLISNAADSRDIDMFWRSFSLEKRVYLTLLSNHCKACQLLFCKSSGTTIEEKISSFLGEKADRTFSMLSALQIPIDYKTVDLMIHASFYFYQKLIENWDGTIYSMQVLDNIEIALYAAWNSLLRK